MAQLRASVPGKRATQLGRLREERALDESALSEISGRKGLDRWVFHTAAGTLLGGETADAMAGLRACGLVYAFEGGNFVRPGIRLGHVVTAPADSQFERSINVTTVSLLPLIFSIDPLISTAEVRAPPA